MVDEGVPIKGPGQRGLVAMGIDPMDNYNILHVTQDGYAILHPDLIRRLEHIEEALAILVKRGNE